MSYSMVEMSNLLSSLTGCKRSPECFQAWMIEEHGHVTDVPANNPANISGPIDRNLAWFANVAYDEQNNVCYYHLPEQGAVATMEILWARYPRFVEVATDEEAITLLGEPDTLGERWCPNPEYAASIIAIYQELKSAAQKTTAASAAAVAKFYTVEGGDTLSEIARRFNTTIPELLKLNPGIVDPNEIVVGETIRLPE